MILLKARRRTKIITVVVEFDDGRDDEEFDIEVEYPDKLEAKAQSTYRSNTMIGDDHIWLAEDDAVPKGDARRCKPTDLPEVRKPGSKIDGLRLVPLVMAGMGDSIINDDGELIPAFDIQETPIEEIS